MRLGPAMVLKHLLGAPGEVHGGMGICAKVPHYCFNGQQLRSREGRGRVCVQGHCDNEAGWHAGEAGRRGGGCREGDMWVEGVQGRKGVEEGVEGQGKGWPSPGGEGGGEGGVQGGGRSRCSGIWVKQGQGGVYIDVEYHKHLCSQVNVVHSGFCLILGEPGIR